MASVIRSCIISDVHRKNVTTPSLPVLCRRYIILAGLTSLVVLIID